jgi:hypothetical protein
MDRNLHITGSNNVLHFEIMVIDFKAHFLYNPGIFPTGKLTILLTLGPSNNHFATTKNQASGLGISQSHDDRSKSIRIILSCLSFPCNLLQIKFTT